eukprot:scaffold21255_cov217-Skeletonema_marinoi.AAC.1
METERERDRSTVFGLLCPSIDDSVSFVNVGEKIQSREEVQVGIYVVAYVALLHQRRRWMDNKIYASCLIVWIAFSLASLFIYSTCRDPESNFD